MSSGHRKGHHTSIAETVAMFGAGAEGDALDAVSILNAAPVGPAAQVTFISAAHIIPGTKVKVTATISGSDSVVDDPITAQLIRDPTASTGAPGGTAIGALPIQDSGHVGGPFAISLSWVDTVTAGTSHTYGVTATAAAGALTLTANKTSITISPL